MWLLQGPPAFLNPPSGAQNENLLIVLAPRDISLCSALHCTVVLSCWYHGWSVSCGASCMVPPEPAASVRGACGWKALHTGCAQAGRLEKDAHGVPSLPPTNTLYLLPVELCGGRFFAVSWEHWDCLVLLRSVWGGRTRCVLLSPPAILPCFPAHSTHVSCGAAVRASLSYFWSSCKNVTLLVCEAQWEGKVFCWARMEGKWSLLDSFLLWSALAVSLLPHSSCPLALFGVLGSTISLLTPLPEWDLQWWGALLPFPLLASPTHPRAALSHLVFLLSSALHPQHHGARWAPGALLLEVSRSSARGWASRAGWAAGVCVPSGWGCVCVCTSLLVLLSGLRLFVYYCNAYVCFAATQSCEEKLLAWDSPGQTLELERARSEPLLTPVVPFVLNSAPCKLAAG